MAPGSARSSGRSRGSNSRARSRPARAKSSTAFRRRYDAAPVDDDYYYELVALRAFEKYGIGMTLDQLGEQWKENSAGSWGSSERTRLRPSQRNQGSRGRAAAKQQALVDHRAAVQRRHLRHARSGRSKPGRRNWPAGTGTSTAMPRERTARCSWRAWSPSRSARPTHGKIVRKAARLVHPASPYRQCLDLVISMAEQGTACGAGIRSRRGPLAHRVPSVKQRVSRTAGWSQPASGSETVTTCSHAKSGVPCRGLLLMPTATPRMRARSLAP